MCYVYSPKAYRRRRVIAPSKTCRIAPEGPQMIQIYNVCKAYQKESSALDNITLKIPKNHV